MATAIATGLHSNTATWDTGVVPGAADPVIIPSGFAVTQDGAWSTGSIDIQPGGELVTNNVLTYSGNITLGGTLTNLDTGAGTQMIAAGGNRTLTQSDGSVWRSAPTGGAKAIYTAAVGFHWLWRDAASTDGVVIDIDNAHFENCGTATINGMSQRGNNAATLNIRIANFLWIRCGQMRLGVGATHAPSAVCQIDAPVVLQPLSNQPAIDYAAQFPAAWVAGSRRIRNAYTADMYPNGIPVELRVLQQNALSNPAFELSFNAGINATARNTGGGNVSVSGAIAMLDYNGSRSAVSHNVNGAAFDDSDLLLYAGAQWNNAHFYAQAFTAPSARQSTVTDAYLEFDSPGGANGVSHKDGGVTVSGCVIVNANPWYTTEANSVGSSLYHNNTHVIFADSEGDASMIQETAPVVPPYSVEGYNNIRVDYRTAGFTADFAMIKPSIPAGTADQFTYLDYNVSYVPAAGAIYDLYPTIVMTGLAQGDAGFGSSDLLVDPAFVTGLPRRLRDFGAAHTGALTAPQLYRELFKRSGYDVLGNAATSPAYTWQDVKAWLLASYVPTNEALRASGRAGEHRGALPLGAPPVPVHTKITQNMTGGMAG